jgi:hypothetical protein
MFNPDMLTGGTMASGGLRQASACYTTGGDNCDKGKGHISQTCDF